MLVLCLVMLVLPEIAALGASASRADVAAWRRTDMGKENGCPFSFYCIRPVHRISSVERPDRSNCMYIP